MDLPNDALDKLKCSQCKQFLSMFPIHSDENGTLICGRCPISTKTTRQPGFETIAQFVNFPCMNQEFGCCHVYTPLKMKTHEDECENSPINCFEECGWGGSSDQLRNHYEGQHKDLLMKPGEHFKVNLFNKNACVKGWFVWMEELYVFRLQRENDEFYGGVYVIDSADFIENYKYNLSFRSKAGYFIEFPTEAMKNPCAVQKLNKIQLKHIDLDSIESCKIEISDTNLTRPKNPVADIDIYSWSSNNSHTYYRQAVDVFQPHQVSINKNTNQLVRCPISSCNFSNKFKFVLKHLKAAHKPTCFLNKIKTSLSANESYENKILIHNGNIFILSYQNNTNYGRGGNSTISVEHYEPTHQSLRFLTEVKMKNAVGEDMSFKSFSSIISLPNNILTANLEEWSLEIKVIIMDSPPSQPVGQPGYSIARGRAEKQVEM